MDILQYIGFTADEEKQYKQLEKELGEKIRELKTTPGCPIAKYQCSRNREQRKQR